MSTLQRAARKAYKSTALFRLRSLAAEESKWKRRETIARNKLEQVRKAIAVEAERLAAAAAGLPTPAETPAETPKET